MEQKNLEVLLYGKKIKRYIDSGYVKIKEEYGLKQIELDILMYFSANPGKCASDLCRYLGFNKGQVSKAIEHLVSMEYISVQQENSDRRYICFCVTEKARRLIDELERRKCKSNAVLFDNISDDEIRQLEKILSKLMKNLEKLATSTYNPEE